MPRIREYAGYGRNGDDSGENRERTYGTPETAPEPAPAPTVEETVTEPVKAEEKPVAAPVRAEHANSGGVAKIVIEEKDWTPKYTDAEKAIESILQHGEFYEDYARGEKSALLSNKEFVLSAIAQKHTRFYASITPKNADWLDEEYITAQAAMLFRDSREGVKAEAVAAYATELYSYFNKNAFSPEAYKTVETVLKRVAKTAAARIESPEESERMQTAFARFQSAVNQAMAAVKEKYAAVSAAETARAEKLAADKKQLATVVDEMKFEF